MTKNLIAERFSTENATDEQWRAVHCYRHERSAADDLGEPSPPDDLAQTRMKTEWPLTEYFYFFVWELGRIVANLEFSMRRPGTQHYEEHAAHLEAWIGVLPPFQRQGYGRFLMGMLREFMRDNNKTKLRMNARTQAGHAFLSAMGGEQRFLNIKNRLNVASADWAQLRAWQLGFTERFHWEEHLGRVPLTRWETIIEPLNKLLADTPKGNLDKPAMRYEMTRLKTWYAELDRIGGKDHLLLLRERAEPNSKIIAVSNASWSPTRTEWASQALTATVRELRGQGFAKAVKARMLEIIKREHPQVQWVETYNAHSNTAMLAINRQMGFQVMREIGTYQFQT